MKTPRVLLVSVMFLVLPTVAWAEPRFLQGRVLLTEPGKASEPAIGVDVTFEETRDKTRTKAHGKFRIKLRELFGPGKKITLLIPKEGWRIEHPLEGGGVCACGPGKRKS